MKDSVPYKLEPASGVVAGVPLDATDTPTRDDAAPSDLEREGRQTFAGSAAAPLSLTADEFEDVAFRVSNSALHDARDFDAHHGLSVNDLAVIAVHLALVEIDGDFRLLNAGDTRRLIAHYIWKLGVCLIGMGTKVGR